MRRKAKPALVIAAVAALGTTALWVGCDRWTGPTDPTDSQLVVRMYPDTDYTRRDDGSKQPENALIVFSAMSAHHVDQGWLDTEQGGWIDLLNPDDEPFEFASMLLPDGHYDQIRFVVDFAGVEVDQHWYPLDIPSGETSGFKVQTDFCLTPGGVAGLDLGWDAEESLHYNDARGWWLTPSLQVWSPPTCADSFIAPGFAQK